MSQLLEILLIVYDIAALGVNDCIAKTVSDGANFVTVGIVDFGDGEDAVDDVFYTGGGVVEVVFSEEGFTFAVVLGMDLGSYG